MTAAELLATHNLTVQQASDWIQANVGNPTLVYNTAMQFGVNSSMLAEIVSSWVPGATAGAVEGFFSNNGLNGAALATVPPGGNAGGDTGTAEVLPADMAALASLVTLNTNGGALATSALRAAVLSELDVDAYYYELFDPAGYEGSGDGTFTAEELGIPGLGNLAATTENMESLYYGTLIKAFKAIDMNEILQIQNFAVANQAGLQSGSQAVMDQYMALMVSVFEDQAAMPLFTDQQLADTIVTSTAVAATLVGGGDAMALFDGLFTGFLPA